jgi:hypothetical protein
MGLWGTEATDYISRETAHSREETGHSKVLGHFVWNNSDCFASSTVKERMRFGCLSLW